MDVQSNFVKISKAAKEQDLKIETSLTLKQAADETCKGEECEGNLDKKLFRGKKGMFLIKSPLYGIESRRYSEHNMPLGQHQVRFTLEMTFFLEWHRALP